VLESEVQKRVRLEGAKRGALLWRNNVGATPSKCPSCNARQRVVRFGLANDSSAINKRFKSSDLIGITPVVITPDMVGRTIGVFTSYECKRTPWMYRGTDREQAQKNWLDLIKRHGGIAEFRSE